MTPKQIAAYCSSLPAATKVVQWEGVQVFKVGGKMFCLIAPRDHSVGRVCFKCPPEHYEALSHSPGFRPAPYLARAKWVSVDAPKSLTDGEMKAYLKRAHAVIAAGLSKKKQKESICFGVMAPPYTAPELRAMVGHDRLEAGQARQAPAQSSGARPIAGSDSAMVHGRRFRRGRDADPAGGARRRGSSHGLRHGLGTA